MKKQTHLMQKTIRGIITPSAWDKNDCVTAVTLSATDDEEYLIENSDELIDRVQMSIQATGIVRQDKNNLKRFLIKNYDIIENHQND